MIIKRDNEVVVLAGRESFRSAFRNSKRKIRNRAHRRLIEELKKRGYYSNGKRPDPLPEIPSIDIDALNHDAACQTVKAFWSSMEGHMEKLQGFLAKLGEPSEPTTFWENPETGQRFSMDSLIVATDLWPMDEVLELIP